jgi:hypothetical protein
MEQVFLHRFPQGFLGISINQACHDTAANGGKNWIILSCRLIVEDAE